MTTFCLPHLDNQYGLFLYQVFSTRILYFPPPLPDVNLDPIWFPPKTKQITVLTCALKSRKKITFIDMISTLQQSLRWCLNYTCCSCRSLSEAQLTHCWDAMQRTKAHCSRGLALRPCWPSARDLLIYYEADPLLSAFHKQGSTAACATSTLLILS